LSPTIPSVATPFPAVPLAGRLTALLPGLAVGLGGFQLADLGPATAAAETPYLALVAGTALAGSGLLAAPRHGAATTAAVLATLTLWTLPAGPGRGVALSIALVAGLLAAAWARLRRAPAPGDAAGAEPWAWAGGALAVQALLRPAEWLPAALDPPALARLLLPPLLAGLTLTLLARQRGAHAAAGLGTVAALAAAGFTATAALPLLAVALAGHWQGRRRSGGAVAPARRSRDGVEGLDRATLALAVLLALPLVALRPVVGGLAAATAVAALLPRWWGLLAALLVGAAGASVLPGLPGITAGAVLLASRVAAPAAWRAALPWLGALLGGAALAAAYPWLRPEPLLAVLAMVGLSGHVAAAIGLAAVAAAVALTCRTRGAWRRRTVAAICLGVSTWVVAAAPPRGRDLLRGTPVALSAAHPEWGHGLGGTFRTLRIESLLTDGADLAQGTPVARLEALHGGVVVASLVLRAGEETGEWAADRPDLRGKVPLGTQPIATLPPPGEWFARAYRAQLRPASRLQADRVRVTLLADAPAGVGLTMRRLEVAR
jgi:hypothetical protein